MVIPGWKTFLTNSILGILAALDLSGIAPIISNLFSNLLGETATPGDVAALVTAVMALVNIGLRFLTKSPIFKPPA